jgi:UDP-3-O-[3-hydroxymyristoyl] glucosamine N-acyltransferase
LTVGELIERLGGELVQGSAELGIEYVCSYEQADASSLIFVENLNAVGKTSECVAGAVVCKSADADSYPLGMCVIQVDQPRLWFARAAGLLSPDKKGNAVDPTAVVSRTAMLGEDVRIGAGAVISEDVSIGEGSRIDAGVVLSKAVSIGKDCHIYPRAVLYGGTTLGDRVVIHAGAVLGADGFGYVRDRETGAYTQFPQQGTLTIEDDVEIGANTTIDRGALAETRIRRGTKIDNLVHIGHNCEIGEDVVIAALVGISGSSTVGKGAVIAGQVGIGDHAHVGPGVILGGQAGVLPGKTVSTTGTVMWGTPAKPLREYLREIATLSRLARRKKD